MLDTERWVPQVHEDWRAQLPALTRLLEGKRLCLLTGAGFSTESGIPDYRGEETERRARNPIRFQKFVGQPEGRQRYWARSMIGWPRFRSAVPNRAHSGAARLEALHVVSGVITQNVDRLHQAAGSTRVIELHGALAEVTCLDCGATEQRDALQSRLSKLNPGWLDQAASLAPDGDADIAEGQLQRFRVADCLRCHGVLKPHVVFFGEGVPKATVQAAFSLLEDSDILLVAGSSLTVFSGYRFVRRAKQLGIPVVIVNVGATRADADAALVVRANVGAVMDHLAQQLPRFHLASS